MIILDGGWPRTWNSAGEPYRLRRSAKTHMRSGFAQETEANYPTRLEFQDANQANAIF